MASVAASTAAACLGKSELLGNQLNLRNAAPAPAPTAATQSAGTSKIVALFGKKKAAPAPAPTKAKTAASSSIDDELAKWYGPDRRIFLPDGLLDRSEIPEYLNGEVPGEYVFIISLFSYFNIIFSL